LAGLSTYNDYEGHGNVIFVPDSLFIHKPTYLKYAGITFDSVAQINAKDSLMSHKEDPATFQGYAGVKRNLSLEQIDGIFALLLFCFLSFTYIYKVGINFFTENVRFVFKPRKEASFFNDTTVAEYWYHILLVLQTIVLSSIVLFAVFYEKESGFMPSKSFFTILLFILTISLFEAIKYVIYRFTGFLFNMREHIKIWNRSYMIITELLGLISFIPVLLLVYSNYYHHIIIGFLIIVFIISRLIIFYKIISFFFQENVNLLFLITYLCTVEIIPYILLYRVLSYMYRIDIIPLLLCL